MASDRHIPYGYTILRLFNKKLGSGKSSRFLIKIAFFENSVSSRFLILARFASFLDEKVNFLRKIDRQFLMHLEHEYSVS